MRNRSSGFSTRSDTNRAVQSKKIGRGLKFQIYKVEGLYYPYSENKGADQLRRYREADLGLCFRICKKPVFSRRGSYDGNFVAKNVSKDLKTLKFCIFAAQKFYQRNLKL